MIDFDGSAEIKIEPTKEAQIEFDKIEINALKHTLSVYEDVIKLMSSDIQELCHYVVEFAGIGVRIPRNKGQQGIIDYYLDRVEKVNK